MDQSQIKDAIDANTRGGFIATLRERFLARKIHINGRAIVDNQGAILLVESAELDTRTPEEAANEVMSHWGWYCDEPSNPKKPPNSHSTIRSRVHGC